MCGGGLGVEWGYAKADAEPGSLRTHLDLTAGSGVGDGLVCTSLNSPQGSFWHNWSRLVGLKGTLLPWGI